jgi:hypothetical protein
MRDPELVARAQRAAARLESAWEQWRALHGLAVAPGQPVVSYVGYSLKEPWGEPRVVIGIDADEAEYLAEFLDRDECAQRGQVPHQQVPHQQVPHQQVPHQQAPHQQVPHQSEPLPLPSGPLPSGPVQPVNPLQSGPPQSVNPLQSGPPQQLPRSEPPQEGRGEYASSSLLGAPVSFGLGRQSPDQVRDIAAEMASWNSGELPGQVAEQLAGWQPSMPLASDQPPASA